MLVKKEIRILALLQNIPEGVDSHDYLWDLARRREPCFFGYDKTFSGDETCLKGSDLMNRKLGVVAWEDKKYLLPLIEKSITKTVKGEFKELYWDENWAPILRYTIFVDLDDVKKDLPGEYWDDWEYHGLASIVVEDWNSLGDSINYLKGILIGSFPEPENIEEILKDIAHKCHYDLSVDTTVQIEDLCFMLEMNHDERSDRWKNRLQRASAARRSKKTIVRYTEKWLPELVKSTASVSLINTFLMRLKAKYNVMDTENSIEQFKMERNIIEKDLQALPYNLYDYINDIPKMLYTSFYKKISFEKMLGLLSAVILRCWLNNILQSKVNTLGALLIPGNLNVEELNILGNIENNQGTLFGNVIKE